MRLASLKSISAGDEEDELLYENISLPSLQVLCPLLLTASIDKESHLSRHGGLSFKT